MHFRPIATGFSADHIYVVAQIVTWRESIPMSDSGTPANSTLEQPAKAPAASTLSFSSDPAMAKICIELFTRATLYAGAIGLIAGLLAALLFGE